MRFAATKKHFMELLPVIEAYFQRIYTTAERRKLGEKARRYGFYGHTDLP